MTKIAQLRDVARAFCLEVWGQALTAIGVSTESELRAANRVYYPPGLRLAPSLSQPLADPSFAPTSVLVELATTQVATLAIKKGQEQPPLVVVVDIEIEEAAEVSQLKRKNKEKGKEKKEGKEKQASA